MVEVMDWLKTILPTIGSLLVPGGPLVGAAIEAIGTALGLSEKTEESVKAALSSGALTAEGMAALKQADNDLKVRLAEMGIKAEELAIKDRADARAMQVKTGSWVPAALALTLTVSYLGIIAALLTGDMKLWSDPTLTLLLGGLTSGFTAVLGYYFGSSHVQPGDKK